MVPISPEIYSSTAVVMDNRSLADYVQRLEDRRLKRAAAEQDAIDNYIKEYGKSLTPTGMKTNDIPDFLQMQQEFRSLSNKYKSTKNPLDKLALDKKADEMFLFINESKGAVEEGKQPTSTLADPNKKNKVDFEALSRDLDLHNLPLKDPNRKKLGALSNYFYPEQFDEVGTFNEASKGIEKSELGTTIVKGEKIIPVGYNENAIKSIAENYLKLVDINPTATNYYKGKLKNLPAEKVAEAIVRVKKYYPTLQIDEDEPFFLKLSDAIETAEKRTSQKIENAPRVSVSTGGGQGGGGSFIDYWEKIKSKPEMIIGDLTNVKKQVRGVPLNSLEATPQKRIIDIANSITGKKFKQRELILQTMPDGSTHILEVLYGGKGKDAIYPTGVKDITTIEPEDINLKPQIDVQSRRKAVEEAKKAKKESVYAGLDANGNPIFKNK